MQIDHMQDDVFMSVTETMALAGEAMESGTTETLLVISLSEQGDNAVLGGDTTPDAIERLQALLEQLAERSEESPAVVHVSA